MLFVNNYWPTAPTTEHLTLLLGGLPLPLGRMVSAIVRYRPETSKDVGIPGHSFFFCVFVVNYFFI
jgi:vacuolar-type H+-ATPase subunit I/STV1